MAYHIPPNHIKHDQLTIVKNQVDDVKEDIRINLVTTLKRVEQIDSILIKSEKLEKDAGDFQDAARKLKRQKQMQALKSKCCIISIALSIICIIIIIVITVNN